MKLTNFQAKQSIVNEPSTVDIDVASRLGPVISHHITSLATLCKLLPNSSEVSAILEELKLCVSQSVDIKDNVLETDTVKESVVYRLDQKNPMDDSEILILGGAGRYTMKALRRKAARESAMLADDLSSDHANYRGAAHNVKQVANTINTLVSALDELENNNTNLNVTEETNKVVVELDDIDAAIQDNFIFEMFDTMYPGLGEKAWVAISKRLKAQGLPPRLVENIINRAIITRSL